MSMQRPPAEIGQPVEDVDTPALIVELDAFEAKLQKMARLAREYGVHLRPHAKTHKAPAIAHLQMRAGAIGVCCQKVSEAEVMVDAGIADVYVSNEVVGRQKVDRLAALARRARLSTCVDHPDQVEPLSTAARKFGVSLGVRVEIRVGNRCGVPPGVSAVDLATQIAASPNLRFEGLQAYNGKAQHIYMHIERLVASTQTVADARATREALKAVGYDCLYIGGAGTGTFAIEGQSGIYNELQAGSYLFMDLDYAKLRGPSGAPVEEWQHSLFVLSTVMSRPEPTRAICDAGLKSVSIDSGPPALDGNARAEWVRGGDDHSGWLYADAGEAPAIGDKVRILPGHVDPTVNMHDWFVGVRDGKVETLWPILARGAVT
jgi:3-hydroxy-D-aspartate aldolase